MSAPAKPSVKGETLSIRLTPECRDRLDRLTTLGPYRLSITSIIERGIELAAQEIETMTLKGPSA